MITKVDRSEVVSTLNQNVYGSSSPFISSVKNLSLAVDINPYIVRVMPANCDPRFGSPTSNFAVYAPQHEGLGRDGKEKSLCPNRLSTAKAHVVCPCCNEYSHDNPEKRAKLKPYMYMNVILMSNHVDKKGTPIPIIDENGQYIVYTVRITKSQVFDEIAKYYRRTQAKVADPCDLTYGCAVKIQVFKKGDFWNYKVDVDDSNLGDLLALNEKGLPYVNVDTIPDLRTIVEWIPTEEAMTAMMSGMSVKDSLELGGKVNIFTGERKGGAAPANTAHASANAASVNAVVPPRQQAPALPPVNKPAGLPPAAPPPAQQQKPPAGPPAPGLPPAQQKPASYQPSAPTYTAPPSNSDVEFVDNAGDDDSELPLP